MTAAKHYAQANAARVTPASSADELILRHADLVKRIAFHLVSRMPPSVEVDDLIQAGMIGLLDAARQYTAQKGASFETYAGIRIRGAMLDEVRRADWTPRSVHRGVREMAEAVRRVENETGTEAKPADVARVLGVSLDEYHRLARDATACRLFSFEQMNPDDEDNPVDVVPDRGPGPADELELDGFRDALAAAIDGLPERERMVLSLYYDQELNLREIGEVLEVTESRVCQIHWQALVRLRARMKDWFADAGVLRKDGDTRG
jgi:RNA polymerase sigma factor for flagellar operon FliA